MDTIKVDVREIGCDDMEWINVAEVREQWMAIENMVMKFEILQQLNAWLLAKKG
jgi:hypothetical protein